MRVHITLEDKLVRELDRRVGNRRRSSFIASAVAHALDDEHRWELIESTLGTIQNGGHAWDDDPEGWVHAQRHGDARRVG